MKRESINLSDTLVTPPGHFAVPLGERLPQRAPTAEEIVSVVDDDGVRHELGFRSERCDKRPVP